MMLVHSKLFGALPVPVLSWSVLHGVTSQLRVFEALELHIYINGYTEFIE
jgi:hypothetical protein